MNTNHCIDICNKLLRGERSAVETYDKAIEKFGHEPSLHDLRRLRDDHAVSVRLLEDNVRSMGGKPSEDAGAWGTFANTVQATANIAGAGTALETLQTGEKAGRGDYESALKDGEVMPECKDLFRSRLMPSITEHIAVLERLQHA